LWSISSQKRTKRRNVSINFAITWIKIFFYCTYQSSSPEHAPFKFALNFYLIKLDWWQSQRLAVKIHFKAHNLWKFRFHDVFEGNLKQQETNDQHFLTKSMQTLCSSKWKIGKIKLNSKRSFLLAATKSHS